MNNYIKFTVPGEPVAKGRPRFVRRGKFTSTYTPKKTADYEAKVRKYFNEFKPKNYTPIEGPVEANALCVKSIPTSLSKKKKTELIGKPCTKKPDTDNIIKSILDPLNGIAYIDDSQVCKLSGLKIYGEVPRVEIEIKPYKEVIVPIRFTCPGEKIKPFYFV